MVAGPAPEARKAEVAPRGKGPVAPPVGPMGAAAPTSSARVRGPLPRPVPLIP